MKMSWITKTMYLRGVLGEDIVSKQDELNSNKSKNVVATQIFPIGKNKDSKQVYDCFIYYKDEFGNVKLP